MKKFIFVLFVLFVFMFAHQHAFAQDKKSKYLVEEEMVTVKDVIRKLEETKSIIVQINNPKMNKNLLIQDIDEIIKNLEIFLNK